MTCPNNELFGPKLFTDICWDCIFPIRVCGGVDISSGNGYPIPSEANHDSLCSCPDPAGIPNIGCSVGFYEHSKLIDITRNAYCAPSLGGTFLQSKGVQLFGGMPSSTKDKDGPLSFMNYIYYAFPLNLLLDLVVDSRCGNDGYSDFDVMYMSPLDPTWNDDEMAFFLNFEAVIFSNPVTIGACAADAAVTAAGGQPIENLFWCAGSWGLVYPFTGNINGPESPVRDSSLLATKAIAALHRRGLATKTVGHDAMCNRVIHPTLPKTQYRMSLFSPVAENHGSHVIGESTFRWGEWRNIPGTGEDFTYVIDRWTDCCLIF